jgi:ATP synthase protein I
MDPKRPTSLPNGLGHAVDAQAVRKIRVNRRGDRSLWFGFGTFGLIGWCIALPTFLGAMLGLWIDRHFPSTHSWTLALLVAGLVAGCVQAWHWISQEEKTIQREEKDDHE